MEERAGGARERGELVLVLDLLVVHVGVAAGGLLVVRGVVAAAGGGGQGAASAVGAGGRVAAQLGAGLGRDGVGAADRALAGAHVLVVRRVAVAHVRRGPAAEARVVPARVGLVEPGAVVAEDEEVVAQCVRHRGVGREVRAGRRQVRHAALEVGADDVLADPALGLLAQVRGADVAREVAAAELVELCSSGGGN